ncbi:MAG: hypothetical protein EAZ11_07370 [Curvibacter sp.]|nr:MAG: hypothetical protein EAZ11_07370 [Curvibacter sp.]
MFFRGNFLFATTLALILHGGLFFLWKQSDGLSLRHDRAINPGLLTLQQWTISPSAELLSDAVGTDLPHVAAPDVASRDANSDVKQVPPKPVKETVLASTFSSGFANKDFLPIEQTDVPAMPAANWILPLKKGYLLDVSSIVVRVWIQRDGTIAGVELLDVRPIHLGESQMKEVVEWMASTPMRPAIKNGGNVDSKRTVEIAFEH